MMDLRFAPYLGECPSSPAGTFTQDAINKKQRLYRSVEGNALTHNIIKRHHPNRFKGEDALVIL